MSNTKSSPGAAGAARLMGFVPRKGCNTKRGKHNIVLLMVFWVRFALIIFQQYWNYLKVVQKLRENRRTFILMIWFLSVDQYPPPPKSINKCVYMYVCVCMYACVHACMCVHLCVCVCVQTCVCVCVYNLSKIIFLTSSLSHHTSQERQSEAVPDLPNNQPHQSPKQSHAEDHTEQTEATSGEDHRWRTGRLQSRLEHHRADLQPTHSMWEISPAPARPLPCLHRLQEGLRQGLACSFVGNHEEVQHQH